MISKGVDVLAVEWNGKDFEKNNYENKIVPSVANRNIKIVLLYDTMIRLKDEKNEINFDKPDKRNLFINDFNMFASSNKYFKNSKYLKFNNMPVVYIYVTRAIEGSDYNIQSAFNAIIQSAKANGFSGLYIVADHLFWGEINFSRLLLMQANAATCFLPVTPDEGVPMDSCSIRPVRRWANKLAGLYADSLNALINTGRAIDLEPGIFVQYDDTGLNTAACGYNRPVVQRYHLCDGSDWDYMIVNAGLQRDKIAEIVNVFPDCHIEKYSFSNYTSIIWVYSYNEWAEGSGCEQLNSRTPAYPYGFELQLLDILKNRLP